MRRCGECRRGNTVSGANMHIRIVKHKMAEFRKGLSRFVLTILNLSKQPYNFRNNRNVSYQYSYALLYTDTQTFFNIFFCRFADLFCKIYALL